ncbi:hypothetical protein HPB50_029319 [Hyalomma asiaticum]|nr:hypothetical protein HPB50_029319 [Hyalomma asiaticum]
MPANRKGSDMTPGGVPLVQKRLNVDDASGCPESKCQEIEVSDDESTVTRDDNLADVEDAEKLGFEVLRHRRGRTVGIVVLIAATEKGRCLRHVNSITLYSNSEKNAGRCAHHEPFYRARSVTS